MLRLLIFFFILLTPLARALSAATDVCPLSEIPSIVVVSTSVIPDIAVQLHQETTYGGQVSFHSASDLVCYWSDEPVAMGPKWALTVQQISTGHVVAASLVPTFRTPASPRFSPDGTTIIFTGHPDTETATNRTGLYACDVKGQSVQRLSPPDVDVLSPTWRPDGKEIAFVKRVFTDWDNPDAGAAFAIAFLDPRHPGRIQRELRLDDGVGYLQYSPDGKWLACTTPEGLAVIHPETGRQYRLFVPATLTLTFSKTAYEPGMLSYGWLPGSDHVLVTVATRDPQQLGNSYQQIWCISVQGETRKVCDGLLLGNSLDGTIVYIRFAGSNQQIKLRSRQQPR